MRKIYSLVLMATMLLVGTSAWAQANVARVNNITTPTKSGDYPTLKQAFDDGVGDGDTATITLLTDAEISSVILMNGGNDNSGDGKRITLDLGDHKNIIGKNSAISMFVLTKGELHITGEGTIKFENITNDGTYTGTDPWISKNQGVCIAVFGSVDPNTTEWSHLIVDENVTLTAAYAAVQLQAENISDTYGLANNTYWTKWNDTKDLNKKNTTTNQDNKTYQDIWTNCNDISRIPSEVTGTDRKATIAQINGTFTKQRPGTGVTLGFGYGIKVDIYGTLIGRLYGLQIKAQITATPKIPWQNEDANFPHIYVHPNCTIKADAHNTNEFPKESNGGYKQPTAIYASGYAIWDIQGHVEGANGVYVKMGEIVVQGNAHISSNADQVEDIQHTNSGVTGAGNAITLQSDWSDGTMGITIKADDNGGTPTIETTANGGAAIVEENTIPQNQVENITIEAGTFNGDVNGCVVISNDFDGDISVSGGTYTGSIETLIDAMEDDSTSIIQTVVAQDGNTATVVIGQKAEGDDLVNTNTEDAIDNFAFVADMSNDIVKLDAQVKPISKDLGDNTHVIVKYLSLTGKNADTLSVVTVGSGKTLEVGQIVMNAYGRLIVEAGGKLVVTGTNGIFADDVNNLVLEAVEGNQSIFLFNPNVKTNRNPKATVEFVSKAYYENSTDYVWQRFGIPTISALTNFTCSNPLVQTQVSRFDNNSGWVKVGYINPTSSHTAEELNPADLDQPFGYYELIGFQSKNAPALTYTMSGSLVGNSNPILNAATKWNGFSNSYTGNISMEKLYESLDGTGFDASVYTYRRNGTGKNMTWEAVNEIADNFNEYPVLEPMQPFLLVNKGAATSHTLQYSTLVYNGGAGYSAPTPTLAPARSSNAQITRVKIHVEREDGAFDNVVLAQDNQFSADYENGRDAEKYMNKHMNIFVTDDAYLNVLATNNLNDTYLGFSCAEGGTYEISFEKVQGKSFTLIDLETNAQVQIEEGIIYQFNVEDNYASDYRFKVVGRQELPTEIEEVENATINNGGIYTITGQYLGDMNLWNTLPAGLYIVNGEKKIK